MTKANLLIAVSIAVLTFSFWAMINRPEQEPAWPETIQGFSFSPYRANQDATKGNTPTVEQIDSDLALLAGRTHAVRTYTVEGCIGEVPRLARAHHINVALGAWIGPDQQRNEAEITRLIEIAKANPHNVVRVMVGNEVVYRKDLPIAQLIGYLDRVRAALKVPVSTAEPWYVWIKHPELVNHVDYIAVHMLPYWEGISVDRAVDYVVDRYNELANRFPGKPIVIAEVGWPSRGRTRLAAVASEANEAIFLRRFLHYAAREKYTYYVMEAFDQPWKRATEGDVGAYWGVWNAQRQPKFPFSRPIVGIPQWRMLAGVSVLVGLITLALLLIDSGTLRKRGRSFLATMAFAAATAAVWVIYTYTQQYFTVETIIVGALLIAGMIGVIVVLLTEAHEWAEARWMKTPRRAFHPVKAPENDLPMISVHVPAYNEPPEMMIQTLDALSRLDYPRYEVIVVDNNTDDPAIWQPVEAHCKRLGAPFRFFHVAPLAGYKAGALNYAMARTAAGAEIVAVIDSDYQVHPRWLRDLAPQFLTASVAIVQAPQDYRDGNQNLFKAMCFSEYRGFFYIGMITRNERNAIIQHGTMTMVRLSALKAVGGWAEWSITEDAELGLRIFEQGLEAVYIPSSYGQGLMPDKFQDFKKQRFRWSCGAIEILRRHAGTLLGWKKSRLTAGQRYHFIAGWLPWMADGINLIFNLAALGWTVAMAVAPTKVDPPLPIFAILPLALFTFKAGKLFYLYGTRVGATTGQTVAAAVAGLSLSHTIARGVLSGMVSSKTPFFRTPKLAGRALFRRCLSAAREEALMCIALWAGAAALIFQQGTGTLDLLLWCIMLVVQSTPYAMAVVVSVISAIPWIGAGPLSRGWTTPEAFLSDTAS